MDSARLKAHFRILVHTSWHKTIAVNVRARGLDGVRSLPIIIERGAKVQFGKYSTLLIHHSCRRASILVQRGCEFQIDGGLILGGRAIFGRESEIYVAKEAALTFGSGLKVNSFLSLNCLKAISFGDDCSISWNVTLMDSDFHPIYDRDGKRINPNKPIQVGDRVWLGHHVLVQKGITVSSGAIVGSGSIVCKDLTEQNTIYAGNPAKITRRDVVWKRSAEADMGEDLPANDELTDRSTAMPAMHPQPERNLSAVEVRDDGLVWSELLQRSNVESPSLKRTGVAAPRGESSSLANVLGPTERLAADAPHPTNALDLR